MLRHTLVQYEELLGQQVNLQKSTVCFARKVRQDNEKQLSALLNIQLAAINNGKHLCLSHLIR